ncbi:hypothetical protein MC378_14125 [Polaribacter sp. MSW13]|uniref:Uncharacterized protein n=1 Tax=Polaribacter marinus TaxID=2916838 RepID=A0A9X1VQ29_9FLAO|nr:hypothetical protein [Polaribacter marinus]MCI2230312.1 hypothetical protein [Polaribacter marinus]
MKKIKLLVLITVFTFLQSCENSDENLLENPNSLTEDLIDIEDSYSKIETEYIEGDIKDEFLFSKGDFKNETLANEETLELITAKLNENFSKQVVYNRTSNSQAVGVFKNGTCGAYKELVVFMDAEDSRNASRRSGFTGSSNIDYRGNVTLRFCVVDNNPFRNVTGGTYAVLNINSTSYGNFTINRHFDNEDRRNSNRTTYNGSRIYSLGANRFGGNTILSFKGYGNPTNGNPGTRGFMAFPNIGVSYGVLGDVYRHVSTSYPWQAASPPRNSYFGYINSDDEDSRNANYCDRILSNGSRTRVSGRVSNLLVADRNTTLYFTKIK